MCLKMFYTVREGFLIQIDMQHKILDLLHGAKNT